MSYDKTRTQYPINIDMPAYELLRDFAADRGVSIPRAATELITRGIARKREDSQRHAANPNATAERRERRRRQREREGRMLAGTLRAVSQERRG